LYRYVNNRPTTFSDPSGKIAPLVALGIGIIIVELAGTGAAYYGISEFDKANSMVAKIPAQNWGPASQKLYDSHVFNGKLGLATAEISQTTTEAYLVMVPVGAAYRPFLVFGRAGTPLMAMSVKTIDAGIKISGVYMLSKEGLTVAKDLRSLDGSDDAFLKAYSSSGKLGGSILGGGIGLKSGHGLWDSKGAMGSMGAAGSMFGPKGEQFGRQVVAQLHVLEGLNRPVPNLTQKQIASLFGAANSSMMDSSFARILQIEQQLLARRVLSPERIAALEAELAALRGAPLNVPRTGPVSQLEVGPYGPLARRSGGDGLTPDHIPSFAAVRANVERQLGRPLTAAEARTLYDQTNTIVIRTPTHQQGSRTYGGRNTAQQIQTDSQNLQSAFQADRAALRQRLIQDGHTPEAVDAAFQQLDQLNRQAGRY